MLSLFYGDLIRGGDEPSVCCVRYVVCVGVVFVLSLVVDTWSRDLNICTGCVLKVVFY